SANNQAYEPAVASDGTSWFVVWHDYRNPPGTDIYGGRVSPARVPLDLDGIPISQAANYQTYPEVGFGGGNYMCLWTGRRSGINKPDLYGARVPPAGTVLDPTGIAIGVGSSSVGSSAYDMAYVSPNFMVVYSELSTLKRARIAAATGAILDNAVLSSSGL